MSETNAPAAVEVVVPVGPPMLTDAGWRSLLGILMDAAKPGPDSEMTAQHDQGD